MQQTLLALLGVIVLGLYGVSYADRSAIDERDAIQRELETAALGATTDWSARLQDLAFDELSKGLAVPVHQDTVRFSSPASAFGVPDQPEEVDPCQWDDVDDFHGYSVVEAHSVRSGTADYQIDISLRYADPGDMERLLTASELSTVKVATIRATYVEPTTDSTAFAFPAGISSELDVALSSSMLTVRRLMRDMSQPPAVVPGCGSIPSP